MKALNKMMLLAFAALAMMNCKSYYQAANFDEATSDHVYVAVLPIKVKYEGKELEEIKQDIIEKAKIEDSKAFQQGMSNEILGSTRRGRRGIEVKMLPASTVLARLNEAGIDPVKSWEMDAQKLAKIVGADAVVIGEVVKNQYFSDAVAIGADIGEVLIRNIPGVPVLNGVGGGLENNKRLVANFELIDAGDGGILWSNTCASSFDWKQRHNDIVRQVSHRIARTFPYRK